MADDIVMALRDTVGFCGRDRRALERSSPAAKTWSRSRTSPPMDQVRDDGTRPPRQPVASRAR